MNFIEYVSTFSAKLQDINIFTIAHSVFKWFKSDISKMKLKLSIRYNCVKVDQKLY